MGASSAARKKSFQRGRFSKQEVAEEKSKTGPRTAEEDAEELERLEKSMAYSHLMPTVDAWGQQIGETLGEQSPDTCQLDAHLCPQERRNAATSF